MTEKNAVEEIKKAYEFRKLNSTDIFVMARLVSKIGIKNIESIFDIDNLTEIADENRTEDDVIKIGAKAVLNVADVIIDRLCDCEDEIYAVLEKTSNLSMKQIKELKPSVFVNMIYDFANKEELADFFDAVLQFVK